MPTAFAPSVPRRRRWLALSTALGLVLLLVFASCSTLGYSMQALAGGAGILAKREPVERVLARRDLPVDERRHLERAVALREFAVRELALPDNRSYTSYVHLGRDVVTWNVVAAPPLAVEPVTWCFPVAGCVSYRGYFREERASRYAAKLRAKGLDVAIQGAVAYSTLGWFADPLLDTFLDDEDWRVGALLFHELAHQVVYLKDDTAFNEGFATAVEELGVERWLARADDAQRAAAQRARAESAWLDALLLAARTDLAAVYAGSASPEAKAEAKRARLERLAADVEHALDDGTLGARYAGLRGRAWNNAHLASAADYTLWVGAFRRLFEESGGFSAFYAAAGELARLDADERARRLEALR
jgi:predicted aminopeptidase